MKPLIATLFVLVTALSLAAEAHSGVVNLTCTPSLKQIVVYHTNGIATPNDDARLNMGLLEKALVQSLETVQDPGIPLDKLCFNFRVTYNPTAGAVNDIWQTARQLYQLAPLDVWRAIADLSLGSQIALDVSGDLTGFKEYLKDISASKMATPAIDPLIIKAHADSYRRQIFDSCGSVLLVPHSQGNLYAHLAYNQLSQGSPSPPAGTIGFVGVASPDVSVPIGTYVTSSTDTVIDGVRALIPTVLPANTDWSAATPLQRTIGSMGHAFEGYLRFNNSKMLLMNNLLEAVNSLSLHSCGFEFSPPNYTAAAPGVVQITITRKGVSAVDESVTIQTSDGTARSGIDYVPLSQEVLFAPGEPSKTVNLTLLNNSSSASGITVNLNLIGPSNGTLLGAQRSATVVMNPNPPGGAFGLISTVATAKFPSGIAFDTAGNRYISEQYRVQRVDAKTGVATTVAGNNQPGFGDIRGNVPATSVSIYPRDIAIDGSGNLLILDISSLLRVDAQTGLISIVTDGSSLTTCSSDGICFGWDPWSLALDSKGNIYISHTGGVYSVSQTGLVTRVAGTGMLADAPSDDNQPATSAQLGYASGIAVDAAGNLYIAEHINIVEHQSSLSRVRRVDAQTHLITTVAGGGTSIADNLPATNTLLSRVFGLALDAAENLYIVDSGFYTVRRRDAQTGLITTVAGIAGVQGYNGDNQPATNATLSLPLHIAFDSAGNLYITEFISGGRIRKIAR